MEFVNEFIQTILTGVSIGCVYGLVALGVILIFKATEVINFAQGELLMLGGFIGYSFITLWHFPYWVALLLTIILMGLFGMLLERTTLRSLVGQPVYAIVIVTIGISFFMRSTVSMVPGWGTDTYGIRTPFTERFIRTGELVLSWEHLSIILMTFVLIFILFAFFRYTRLGTAMRATSQNQLAAVYMGISVTKVFSLTWTIAAALGGIGGILLAPITFVHMNMGLAIGLKAFPAAALGGFRSLPGAIVGGLIIGITESLSGFYLPQGWKSVAAWIILIGVLIIRPQGLFGIQEKKKV
jgi:branched-chain amino acid transport system permease protein